jgi:hypothetical protein
MPSIILHTGGYVISRTSDDKRVVIRRILPQHSTTATERFLLMAIVVLLPLQSDLPKFGEISFLFIMFAVLAGYVALCRLGALVKTLRHPVFLAGSALVGIGFLMEVIHGSTGYIEVFRVFLMLMGAALIASLCRDRRALNSGLYGILLAGVWLSALLFLSTYSSLSLTTVSNFSEASQLRIKSIHDTPLTTNWNAVAFFTAQGALVALALALTARAHLQYYVFFAIGAFCLVGTFLPMSRTALVILALASAAILYARGIMQVRVVVAAAILAVSILVFVPEAVFSRLTISTEKDHFSGKHVDSRTETYTAVIEHLPEYVLIGVGMNYYNDRSRRTGLNDASRSLSETHNWYAQVTVYWGLPGLLALLVFVWQAYRCLPKRHGAEPLSLCLLGVAVSVMVWTFFVHNLESKEFSIALGLLAGANLWIWPKSSPPQRYNSTGQVSLSRHESHQSY